MKKVIILQHDGGEMGNQLWNYASIYAYCVERGFACENWSFFEYARYFKNTLPKSNFLRSLFFEPFANYNKRKFAYRTRIWRRLYKFFVALPVMLTHKQKIVYSSDTQDGLYYLPPTKPSSESLANLERVAQSIYFSFVNGGVFRNPVGLEKHRDSVSSYFSPAPDVEANVNEYINPLRGRYKTIIGVHIRQGDYANFKGGKFRVSQGRVREILDEYCAQKKYLPSEVCFIVASDGPIDLGVFKGLNIEMSRHNAGEDLFILASCNAIIGSDSTFGNFASYYGNIPHIIMKNDAMDWGYYADKSTYFINKYFTVMLN